MPLFPSKSLSISLGALALGLVTAGYLWQKKFLTVLPSSILNVLPHGKKLRRPKSKSDLREGNFDTIEEWLRSKSFTQGSSHIDPQLEQIVLRLLSAIEEVQNC